MSTTDVVIVQIAIYWPIMIYTYSRYHSDSEVYKLETRMRAEFDARIEALSKRLDNTVDREYRAQSSRSGRTT